MSYATMREARLSKRVSELEVLIESLKIKNLELEDDNEALRRQLGQFYEMQQALSTLKEIWDDM